MGLYHEDVTLMGLVLGRSPNRFALAAAGVVLGIVVWILLPRLRLGERPPPQTGLIVLIALGLSAPTLAVETIGSMWTPGSRWRMIYQFTTPALYLGLLALLATRLGAAMWRAGVAALFSAALILSFAHNERQVAVTLAERNLLRAIASDATRLGVPKPLQYLVLLNNDTRWQSSDMLSQTYARTWFLDDSPSFRLIPSFSLAGLQPGPPVIFLTDDKGVADATVDRRTLPYSQIRVIRAEKGRYTVLDRLDKADLAGFRAEWQRDGAIDLRR